MKGSPVQQTPAALWQTPMKGKPRLEVLHFVVQAVHPVQAVQLAPDIEAKAYFDQVSSCAKEFWSNIQVIPVRKMGSGVGGTVWQVCSSQNACGC